MNLDVEAVIANKIQLTTKQNRVSHINGAIADGEKKLEKKWRGNLGVYSISH